MNKIQRLCLGFLSTTLSTGVAHALTPCDGFEVKIKNNLAEMLITSKIKLDGALIQPSGFQRINSHSETVFTVSGSEANTAMAGELVLNTISLPTRTVHINFDLSNQLLICSYTDRSSSKDYSIGVIRSPGQLTYTISN